MDQVNCGLECSFNKSVRMSRMRLVESGRCREGWPGQEFEGAGLVSRAIFVFNTRNENKRARVRDLRAPRRSDLSAARPVASHRTRHYCACTHPKCTFINRRRVSLLSLEGHPPSRRVRPDDGSSKRVNLISRRGRVHEVSVSTFWSEKEEKNTLCGELFLVPRVERDCH